MQNLIQIIVIFLLSWFILDNFYYSPKEQIKRLSKKMFMNRGINHLEMREFGNSQLEESDKKTQKLINLLIEKYLDEEKDCEFIKKYRDEKFINN